MSDAANAPTPVALSPEAQASLASVSSAFAALITGPVQGGSARSGDAASAGDDDGDLAGASGGSNDSIKISKGGIIAIAVVVSCVVVFGIVSTILFYLAKKRSWEVRATLRRSAKRVATALTPRRTTFPKDALKVPQATKKKYPGRARMNDVPPTPRLTEHDIEKAHAKADEIEMREPSKWARFGRPRN